MFHRNFLVPNTDHEHGHDACVPAVPLSPYQLGPKGQGRARVQVKTEGIQMRFSLVDVRTPGDNPADGVTFTGRISIRQTSHGRPESTCTFQTAVSIDVPCSNGTCFATDGILMPH